MLDPDQALEILREGNRQFLSDEAPPSDLPHGHERRLEIARSHTPFAVLVSCSDSRVPPELLFGRGLGELFIVRNAGNTVDQVALGSIEYAVHVLGVRLIVVLGHQRCGAVDSAIAVVERGVTYPGSIGSVIEPIIPAVIEAKQSGVCGDEAGDLWDIAVRENIRRVVNKLRSSEAILQEPLQAGTLKIIGAYYDLDDGHVDFMTDEE